MQIKTISYQRVKNLGDGESVRLEAVADLEKGEEAEEAVYFLQDCVAKWIEYVPGLLDNLSPKNK